ncbi:PcfK-like family protein [Clostridium sp. CX1]|uniref:PcfK-like family protein n=1 Tax=Clostridium sp. CX1 TaxID=2978346 RepID=UPI0021BFB698|nr:PcfK-like family protein [Clostridium sp. CX1]MCT8975521.1 PcfK-like family protein [Clostridium sp. CX1]
MIVKAINKLKTEMNKETKDPYVKAIGEFLLQHVNRYPAAAEKILAEDKTIAKSINEMANVARKKAVNGRAMLTDQEGFEIVLKYFGIKDNVDKAAITPEIEPSHAPVENIEPKPKKDIDFDVSLEDFL